MLEKELCQVLWAFLKVVLSGSEERVVADRKVGIMHVYRYGNMEADIVLIQLAGNHDISEIKDEVAEIQHLTSMDFELIAVKVDDWNKELSPWKTPAVFGNEDFGDGAVQTLEEILLLCSDKSKTYYIGGYSLSGLFSLWAACQTDLFSGIAAASPSVWFPGFIDYMKEYKIKSKNVYLSLGNKEEKTRNPVMAKVGDCIREGHAWIKAEGVNCTLEWNQGGHFKEPMTRTARAFAWVMQQNRNESREGSSMKTREEVLKFGLSFKNVYEERPFKDQNWQLVRVKESKKAFLWIYEKDGYINLNVKVNPEWRDFWRSAYDAVIAGYHQNKEHWNTIILDGTIPDKDIKRMIAESYDIITDSPTKRIYEAVKKIPKGHVATYGKVAEMAGNAKMSRAVGNALHKNPDPEHIPCFRVVNAKGELAGAFAFGGEQTQAKLLEEDGVEVIDGKVDLKKYGIEMI
jgi:O-6-methylguanine DNA methyltransferase